MSIRPHRHTLRAIIFRVFFSALLAGLACAMAFSQTAEHAPGAPPAETQPASSANQQPPLNAPPKRLSLFGSDLFTGDRNPFALDTVNPAPAGYLLGAGDTLSVVCWNNDVEHERSTVTVSPKGDVYLKLLGAIPVASKSVTEAETILRQRYAKFFKNFDLSVQLVSQRTMAVFVLGEVHKPGTHLLPSLSTAFSAIYSASGPTPLGSLRRIKITREQKLMREIDLYDFLLRGEIVDVPLRAGDTVFVPLCNALVSVDGEVRRPAKYEIFENDTLEKALELSGGVTACSADRVLLSRVGPDRKRIVTELNLPRDGDTKLQDGDEIRVLPVLAGLANGITIEGAVNRPGSYPYEKASFVSNLLALSEGLTKDAYADQAIIERQDEHGIRQSISINVRDIIAHKSTADVKLRPGDIVRVFKRGELPSDLLRDCVRIEGEVINPGDYPYAAGMRVSDLMRLSLGVTTNAYFQKAQIIRYPADSTPQLQAIDLAKALAGEKSQDILLQPRDRVIIKSRLKVAGFVVRVDGEVTTPGPVDFFAGMKVSDAIFLAGGLKPDVTLEHALLVRLNEITFMDELIDLSLRKVLAHDEAADLTLRESDRIIIYNAAQIGERTDVTVTGSVVAPGSFAYLGKMRLSHLLVMAKGLLPDAYTERADIYRTLPDKTVKIIAVNPMKALGNPESDDNIPLLPQDRLVVSSQAEMGVQRVVKIDGFVRKPGTYTLTSGMKLSDALHLAGGLKQEAIKRADIYRSGEVTADARKFEIRQEGDTLTLPVDPLLQANDLISIQGDSNFVLMTDTVSIEGSVNHPGTYPANDGTRGKPKTLYHLLAQAGGPHPDAYPGGMVLYRKRSAIQSERQMQELVRTMRDLDAGVGIPAMLDYPKGNDGEIGKTKPPATPDNTANPAPDGNHTFSLTPDMARTQNVDSISQSLAKVLMTDKGNTVVMVIPPRSMQKQQISLSIPIDAEMLMKSKGKKGDILLEPGDVVYIPKQPTTVTVIGGVINNGSVFYQPNKSLNHYIEAVGGVSADGEKKRAIVIRMNGLALPADKAKGIHPGDIIIIPTKNMLRTYRTQSEFQQVFETISSMALSVLPFVK